MHYSFSVVSWWREVALKTLSPLVKSKHGPTSFLPAIVKSFSWTMLAWRDHTSNAVIFVSILLNHDFINIYCPKVCRLQLDVLGLAWGFSSRTSSFAPCWCGCCAGGGQGHINRMAVGVATRDMYMEWWLFNRIYWTPMSVSWPSVSPKWFWIICIQV